MTILDDMLDETGCAAELSMRPRSWEELMTAIAAGPIDCDLISTITTQCIALADANETSGLSWADVVTDALLESDGELDTPAARTLIACGQAADDLLMGQAEAAQTGPRS